MKKSVAISLAIMLSVSLFGKRPSIPSLPAIAGNLPTLSMNENGQIYTSINDYMARFVRYPEGVNSFGIIGTVVVEFEVSSSGSISKINVLNSLSYEIDQEVIKVLSRTSGSWKPAYEGGKPVNKKTEVAVVFKPNKNYDLHSIALKSREKAREKLFTDNDPKKAIKYYDQAIQVLPYELSFFAERGLCKYEIGDVNGAKEDWARISYLKAYDPSGFTFLTAQLDPSLQALKGFAQLKQTVK